MTIAYFKSKYLWGALVGKSISAFRIFASLKLACVNDILLWSHEIAEVDESVPNVEMSINLEISSYVIFILIETERYKGY